MYVRLQIYEDDVGSSRMPAFDCHSVNGRLTVAKYIPYTSLFNTYAIAMYQFLAANDAAAWKSDMPTRVMVGAITRGPMNFIMRPMRPLRPRKTSKRDAKMIAP